MATAGFQDRWGAGARAGDGLWRDAGADGGGGVAGADGGELSDPGGAQARCAGAETSANADDNAERENGIPASFCENSSESLYEKKSPLISA